MARLEEPSNRKPILCAVEGPYDDLPALPTHKIVVMIAGGTGITPILGILRSWIAQPSLAPAMVYLIWTSRSFEELCLLDSALVDLASNDRSSSAPWKLVLSLHYTGQKTIDAKHSYCATVVEAEESMQDLSENVSQAEVKKETSMSSTVSRSDSRVLDQQPNNKIMTRVSTFYRSFSSVKVLNAANAEASPPVAAYNKPLLVPTPSNNPLLYSLLAILCFFGAYGGLILPTWYQVDLAATTTDGAMWFALGMLYVVCVMAGATIPPLCLLLAIAAVRKTFASRSGKYATKKGLSAAFFSPSSIQVSNGGGLCLASKLTGYAVPVQTRRPDVKSALKRVLDQHRGEAEVPVYVGGPEGFMDVTRKEVEALNNERWVPSGPYLWFKKVVAW